MQDWPWKAGDKIFVSGTAATLVCAIAACIVADLFGVRYGDWLMYAAVTILAASLLLGSIASTRMKERHKSH